jgi:hypothetical protein
MISITRDNNEITLHVDGSHEYTFPFKWNTGQEWSAQLLQDDLVSTLKIAMQSLAEEAYTKGWKDAKAKRAAETYFGWAFWRLFRL